MRTKCTTCGKLTEYHGDECNPDDVRRHRQNLRRRTSTNARAEAMRSAGMVRVRGALGGTYWE